MDYWSMLPCELLCEIALKLDSVEDVAYFSAVCSSWQCAFSMIKKMWTPTPTSVPWLLLPENTKENPHCLRKLFCPNRRRCYELELPETFGARCWGTSSGWLVTFDLTLELYVFNPFTGVRIRLPPQSTMPVKLEDYKNDFQWLRKNFVDKAYVFDVFADDFVVVVLQGGFYNYHIAYARPGDEAWTRVVTLKRNVHDVVRRGTQLLVAYDDGMLGYCDISTFQKSQRVRVRDYLPMPPVGNLKIVPFRKFYLMESFGHLLLVLRYKEAVKTKTYPRRWDKDACYRTLGFDVYMFNFDTKNWKIVQDLGDVALFVGNNCSMAVEVSATSNCKRNCIYFTDDETRFWSVRTRYGGHDMGIYDVEQKKIEPVYKGDDIRSAFCTAIWFMPKFFS